MLGFLRRHQRYFFIMITIVIVISFSFFGTYNTLATNPTREQVAFQAVDGSSISRHEVDEMALFLGTDSADKAYFGAMWGPNFLNDGVLKKDFLDTGMAAILAAAYPDEIKQDLYTRWEKEKKFVPYKHPYAPYIDAESAWTYFAPNIKAYYQQLKQAENPNVAFPTRVNLFLAEKKFPAPALQQVLRYQERQYGWVTPDESLPRADLSLFGYHTFEDWFGPRFLRIISEFIINASKIAEQRGYQVTKADALADLIRNSEKSYAENRSSPNLGVASSSEYYAEQLRRMGMDQNRAVKVWQQVMLFRRLFHDLGNSMFIDPFTYQQVNQYAMEMVKGDLFRLPEPFRFSDYRSLQKFEIYLDAISKRPDTQKGLLLLPEKFLSAAEISKNNPGLVQKQYLLEVASVNKKMLQSKVSVRDTWNWELEEKNWTALKKEFPELGLKKGGTRDERYAALDSLDDKTRERVDEFARKAIVSAEPEKLAEALQKAPADKKVVALHQKGLNAYLPGIKDSTELVKLLDQAPLPGENQTAEKKAIQEKLNNFTADDSIYYRINVLERSPNLEILTFNEALRGGILDKMLHEKLEAYYKDIRSEHQDEFQKDSGWRPFADVMDEVADLYFAKILKAIRTDYASAIAPEKAPRDMIGDVSASLRFYAQARDVLSQLQKDPSKVASLTQEPQAKAEEEVKLKERAPLVQQWKFERLPYTVTRSGEEELVDKTTVFALNDRQWSKVKTPVSGDLTFFELQEKGNLSDNKSVGEKVEIARGMLSNEAQQQLMTHVLKTIKNKNAISLAYLDVKPEMTNEEPQPEYPDGW